MKYVVLAKRLSKRSKGVAIHGLADPEQTIRVTVEVRRKAPLPPDLDYPISAEEFGETYGASASDLEAVVDLAQRGGLSVVYQSRAKRIVEVSGKRKDVLKLFPTVLRDATIGEEVFTVRTGALRSPRVLDPAILSVSGLDDQPLLEPHLGDAAAVSTAFPDSESVSVRDIAGKYGFISGTGEGAIVAIIEFDSGFAIDDVKTYRGALGIRNLPKVTTRLIGRGLNRPGTSRANKEAALDMQIVTAVAPDAEIRMYMATRTPQDILRAIKEAVFEQPVPTAISMSWGLAEDAWDKETREAFGRTLEEAQALGITFFASSGDKGSGSGQPVPQYPATDPVATACGGTQFEVPGDMNSEETVWDSRQSQASGGGFSPNNLRPTYQDDVESQPGHRSPKRGIPDVSGYASLRPGYRIVLGGTSISIGGTSAVAPLYAGFLAVVAGQDLIFKMNRILYANQREFVDITQGNSMLGSNSGHSAEDGWDACTGLGRADGSRLAAKLRASLVRRP